MIHLVIDMREFLNFFDEITGSAPNNELLGNLFSNFCVRKSPFQL